uniref:ABC transporter B family member 11-like n=1 Tax=Rhizophora mucronata TaxID=61149 RepID=A0A2P2MWX6_RHIMU
MPILAGFLCTGVSQSTGMAPERTKAQDSAASIFAILDRKVKIDSNSGEGLNTFTCKWLHEV